MDLTVADLMVATVADLIFDGVPLFAGSASNRRTFNAFSFDANGDPIYALFVPEFTEIAV